MSGGVTTGIAWLDFVIVVSGVVVAIGAGYKVFSSQVAPVVKQLIDFLDDWTGEPARPGVPARSGVMDRLAQLENNGGKSLKDKVDQTLVQAERNYELALSTQKQVARTDKKIDDHIIQAASDLARGKVIEAEIRQAIAQPSTHLEVHTHAERESR